MFSVFAVSVCKRRRAMATLQISPTILNSAGPWATTLAQLQDLYNSPMTGAITTRTCTLDGFPHDDGIHQYSLFDIAHFEEVSTSDEPSASINTLGYSPLPLSQTLRDLATITNSVKDPDDHLQKSIIISITGSTQELKACIDQIALARSSIPHPLFVEINLSCPNISGKPPPAFSAEGLIEYFTCLRECTHSASKLHFGIKTPPYSNPENFHFLEQALLKFVDNDILDLPLQFITATNTLGCSLALDENGSSLVTSKDGSGIGGLAGAPLHALSLGNVHLIRKLLLSHKALQHIQIIGVGGVSDRRGVQRMRCAGADFIAVGTALAMNGLNVFHNM
jgi:dihydroorotate dehydrogenase (fumarate)